MKLLPQEIRRIRQNALLEQKVSPDTKLEVTKKDLEDFKKEVLTTLQRNKRIKSALVEVLEIEEEQ